MKHTLLMLLAAAFIVSGCGADKKAAPPAQQSDAHEDEQRGDEPSIQLTAEQVESSGIVLAAAGPASIRETLPLYGVIVPNAERVRDVTARFPGVIHAVNAAIGDSVREGQTLANIESD
jgi:cobalt-zinc-cadmium efflux system membrane fusion protein